ncbi:MAG: DUF4350 domain-containing protein [Candidatus Hydrogenedentes bacterium]|nr:DUF4350 domain-containing protein [Candidatus Hydrogenedentota bacterium]
MRSYTRLYSIALILVVAGFVYGAAKLMLMRYSSGDVYPAYSTYRTDPLGAKAFYESLDSLPGRHVRRNVEPLRHVAGNRQITLYVNGMTFLSVGNMWIDSEDIEGGFARDLDEIMMRGGRVVLSFAPLAYDYTSRMVEDEEFQRRMDRRFGRNSEAKDEDEKRVAPLPPEITPTPVPDEQEASPEKIEDDKTILAEPPVTEKHDAEDSETGDGDEDDGRRPAGRSARVDDAPDLVQWKEQWGVEFQFKALTPTGRGTSYEPVMARRVPEDAMAQTLAVHTALYFEPQGDDWTVLYAYDGRAVVMERPVGDGSLVLVADAFLFSNEAMLNARDPELLAWTAGPNAEVVFDEVTLGVMRAQGLVTLMWQYRMQGIFAALIVIAILYIWKNGQPLAPAYEDDLPADASAYTGKDSASGFVNLLRRSVPRHDILRTCIAEFERSFLHRQADFAGALRDAKAIAFREEHMVAKYRDAARAYREICALFAKHRLR